MSRSVPQKSLELIIETLRFSGPSLDLGETRPVGGNGKECYTFGRTHYMEVDGMAAWPLRRQCSENQTGGAIHFHVRESEGICSSDVFHCKNALEPAALPKS